MMGLKDYSTAELVAELTSRDGTDWEEVQKGKQYNYAPPKDGFLMIVAKDAKPHMETLKDKLNKITAEFAEELFEHVKNGDGWAAEALIKILTGR